MGTKILSWIIGIGALLPIGLVVLPEDGTTSVGFDAIGRFIVFVSITVGAIAAIIFLNKDNRTSKEKRRELERCEETRRKADEYRKKMDDSYFS